MVSSSTDQIVKEIPPIIRLFKDGTFQKLSVPTIVPAGDDPSTGVTSKDVVYSPETNNFARLYLPKTPTPHHKLPLLIYFHGGGFIIESADSALYHHFLNLLVSESNVAAVSVDYRTAPEFPLPAAYDDSWEAIKWVADHANGKGSERWLNQYADMQNVFIAGDSAGANIAHNMAVRVGSANLGGITFRGAILLHPYFWGKERVRFESELEAVQPESIAMAGDVWALAHPGSSWPDDPLINPGMDPGVAGMVCSKILVCIGEKDFLRGRGWYYKEVMETSGWTGELQAVEDEGEGHVFFLFNPSAAKACTLRSRICTFINEA